MRDRIINMSYANVPTCISGTYTCSHGITPGVALLRTYPLARPPAAEGDLLITDNVGTVRVRRCRLDALRVSREEGGEVWTLTISDRRWKWRELGAISGWYNQLDPHGKLIPWTIRSPGELVALCLERMGEIPAAVDMPPGLTAAQGLAHFGLNPPHIGVVPVTGTNPPVSWDAVPPAQALQQLCDLFGRRVVYDPVTDRVSVVRPGVGGRLPPGSTRGGGPALEPPETPDGVGVVGSPTKFQARFRLEAVGREWDGSDRPINLLSYAPRVGGAAQRTEATVAGTAEGCVFDLFVNGVQFAYTAGPGDTDADVAAALAAAVGASQHPDVSGVVTASAAGAVLTVEGAEEGEPFEVETHASPGTSDPPADPTFEAETARAASKGHAGWDYSAPPLFPNVRATDRLSWLEAQRLAQQSVFRTYRITELSPEISPNPYEQLREPGPLVIPGFGRVLRRQQVVLLDTQVEQVTPQDKDNEVIDPGSGAALTRNFYDGYSRDKPAEVFGAVARVEAGELLWPGEVTGENPGAVNTPFDRPVLVDFSIDPVRQLVTFARPVYFWDQSGGRSLEPVLVLQTGCHVRDAATNQLVAYARTERVRPGGDMFAVARRPDVQLNVFGVYDRFHRLTGVRLLELDALARAEFYLAGLKAQYFPRGGETREYNGIVVIPLDGAIEQVTWTVSEQGAFTTASRNGEHAFWVPPYPARRRAEFLAPAQIERSGIAALLRDPFAQGGG